MFQAMGSTGFNVAPPAPHGMNDGDHEALTALFDRLRHAEGPRDPAAEAWIADALERDPALRYRVVELAVVQMHALAAAHNRIQELEHQHQGKGGFLGGLFGGSAAPRPQPVHAPGYRPGMFSHQGSFLGNAATTAVGVMGGMLMAGALMSMLDIGEAEAAEEPAAEDTGAQEFEEEQF